MSERIGGDEQEESAEEQGYIRGHRAAWTSILRQAISELGMTGRTVESLIVERECAMEALRRICQGHGDNDWSDDLGLADVIEKHLARHLE